MSTFPSPPPPPPPTQVAAQWRAAHAIAAGHYGREDALRTIEAYLEASACFYTFLYISLYL